MTITELKNLTTPTQNIYPLNLKRTYPKHETDNHQEDFRRGSTCPHLGVKYRLHNLRVNEILGWVAKSDDLLIKELLSTKSVI